MLNSLDFCLDLCGIDSLIRLQILFQILVHLVISPERSSKLIAFESICGIYSIFFLCLFMLVFHGKLIVLASSSFFLFQGTKLGAFDLWTNMKSLGVRILGYPQSELRKEQMMDGRLYM